MSKSGLNIALAASSVVASLNALHDTAESASETMRRAAPALAGIPDRVSINPKSPHFWKQYKKVGVRIDGKARLGDVHEFCVSEGWAMVRAKGPDGRWMMEDGEIVLEKVEGRIEPYLRAPINDGTSEADQLALAAAEEKRRRKAEKRARCGN